VLPPATKTRARQAWDSYLSRLTPDPQEMSRLAFTVPVLLRPDVLDYLEHDEGVGAGQPGEVMVALLRGVQQRIGEESRVYQLGAGPVEALWGRLESGELSLGQATLAAKGLPVTEALTPPYVERLLWTLDAPAAKPQTWRQARVRGQLVRAAADACDRAGDPAFRIAYCRGVVHWAHFLLISVPDNVLLQEATRLGEEVLAAAQAAHDQPGLSGGNYELAALWTDPYCAGRSSTAYATDEQVWRMRAHAELGRADGRPAADYEMPAAEAGLEKAMTYWRAARDANPDNVPTLAGLAEACIWLERFNGKPLADDAVPAIKHGLELVGNDPDQLAMKSRLLMLASVTNVPVEPASALATADPDAIANRYGDRAGTIVLQEVIGLSSPAPQLALTVLDRQRELLLEPGRIGDSDFRVLSQTAARVLHHAIGVPGELQLPERGQDFEEYATGQLSRLGADAQPEQLAASLLWLAHLSTGVDAEATGLRLVAALRQTAPLFSRRYEWLLLATEATLLTGVGVNAYNRDDLPEALRAYLSSLAAWLRQERLEPVRDLLARLADIAAGADDNQVALEITAGIISMAPVIAAKLGGAADDHLTGVFAGVLGALLGADSVNTEVLWTILEFAKGLRTAMLLDRTKRVSVRTDSEAAAILQRIAARRPGTQPPLGLYREFERRRQQLLLSDLSSPALLDLEQARLALDHRTVLVSSWTVTDRQRRLARVAGVFWDDGQAIASTGPLPPDLPTEQIPWLPQSVQGILADRTAEGRDHLCILPDQGLHVAPWHLYKWDGRMLADDWIVTLLPHPHLLFAGRGALKVMAAQSLPVLAVGVRHSPAAGDLPPLDDAPAEASEIARRLGGRALLDDEATEEAIAKLAPSARYLHVACHGRFEPTAPAFHALLVQPHDENDGVLCAWEVAELDLRTARLVTLSACETAKMVIESGANVDGLPIAFLMAGAKAIIGTQWDIETTASRHFFEELYGALAHSDDLRDAFRAAQAATRSRFPDPQLWAAFYVLGDWR
jgi:hypothetical protein